MGLLQMIPRIYWRKPPPPPPLQIRDAIWWDCSKHGYAHFAQFAYWSEEERPLAVQRVMEEVERTGEDVQHEAFKQERLRG